MTHEASARETTLALSLSMQSRTCTEANYKLVRKSAWSKSKWWSCFCPDESLQTKTDTTHQADSSPGTNSSYLHKTRRVTMATQFTPGWKKGPSALHDGKSLRAFISLPCLFKLSQSNLCVFVVWEREKDWQRASRIKNKIKATCRNGDLRACRVKRKLIFPAPQITSWFFFK